MKTVEILLNTILLTSISNCSLSTGLLQLPTIFAFATVNLPNWIMAYLP